MASYRSEGSGWIDAADETATAAPRTQGRIPAHLRAAIMHLAFPGHINGLTTIPVDSQAGRIRQAVAREANTLRGGIPGFRQDDDAAIGGAGSARLGGNLPDRAEAF